MAAPATVLVVDDDRANLESVARIFQHEGMTPLTASDGQEALELLRRPEVAVLVTDLMMPGMDGQELLAAARTVRPDVEVVLMTAYGTVEAAVHAMKDGAYDFLTKPLKRHALVKTVEKALERHALLAENQQLKARLADLGAPGGGPWWASPPPSAPSSTPFARRRPPAPRCCSSASRAPGRSSPRVPCTSSLPAAARRSWR